MDADTVIALAQSSVDSDICRSLIDLDRCMFLQEHGYDVLYREEVFFAHKRQEDVWIDGRFCLRPIQVYQQ